jgi:beta-mannanase
MTNTFNSRFNTGNSLVRTVILAMVVFACISANCATAAYRINAGGAAYTDAAGNAWSADKYFNTGGTYTNTHGVGFTSDPRLFQSSRYDPAGGSDLVYSLPIANGTYQVRLYFAELFAPLMKVGARVFNVTLENKVVFSNFDVYATAGANRAVIKTATVTVTDGVLNIGFQHVVQNPMVSAIEVLNIDYNSKALLGSYYGNQGFNMAQVKDLETWQGKRNAVINLFQSWCQTENTDVFTRQLPNIWANGNVPLVTWEPFYCTATDTPSDVAIRAANGQYDAYLNDFTDRLKLWLAGPDGVYGTADDRRIYFRLAHEMNGNWYPWSGNPTAYIAMWQHVKSTFESKGIDISHAQFMWVINVGDKGSYKAEQYYPGDGYVDWVGVDGYNAYTPSDWLQPPTRFDASVARLKAITSKPIAIVELGVMSTTTTGISAAAKAQWITEFFAYLLMKPDIKLICYFNKDLSSSSDYAVLGGMYGTDQSVVSGKTYLTYKSYQSGVQGQNLVPSDIANPRLLTDSQFMGKF